MNKKQASTPTKGNKTSKALTNEEGFLTLDFLFSSLVFGIFASLFFGVAMTFSVVEVVQYATFSSARSYSLGHSSEADQLELGQNKFNTLVGNPALAPLVSNGWFELSDVAIADFNDELASDKDRADDAEMFIGARVQLNAPILFKRLPLLGSTASDRDAFLANIQSFLGREPSQEECVQFTDQRKDLIADKYSSTDTNAYVVQTDNGC